MSLRDVVGNLFTTSGSDSARERRRSRARERTTSTGTETAFDAASDALPLLAPPPQPDQTTRIVVDPSSVWRATWAVVAVIAIVTFVRFFFSDASSAIFLLVMGFFFALAVEPLVLWLSRWMPRGLATATTMLLTGIGLFVFFLLFGGLLFDQLASLVSAAPSVASSALDWVNNRFGTSYNTDTLLSQLNLTTDKVTSWATQLAGGVFGLVGGILSSALSMFAFVFFAFYISANMPNLRNWIAGILPPRQQVFFLTVWQLILTKVGGYVGARLILALISGTASGLFMWAIGMPYWLPLAIWTGFVAQFVPNVGTYIAIVLPVLVGLTSSDPRDGIWILVFAIAYQQVENLTIEPRISARAVDVHPAVSFASALIGAQLFGIAGAMLGVPVAATVIALFDIYKQRYDVTRDVELEAAGVVQRSLKAEESDGPDADSASGDDPLDHLEERPPAAGSSPLT